MSDDQIIDPPDTPIYRDPAEPRAYEPRDPVGPRFRELEPGTYWSDVLYFDEFYRWAKANRSRVEVLQVEPPETRPASWWEKAGNAGEIAGEPLHWVSFRVLEPVRWYGFGSLSQSVAGSRADTLQRPPPEDYRDALRRMAEGVGEFGADLAGAARTAPAALKMLLFGGAFAIAVGLLLRSKGTSWKPRRSSSG